jgi:predicted oxidoreductase
MTKEEIQELLQPSKWLVEKGIDIIEANNIDSIIDGMVMMSEGYDLLSKHLKVLKQTEDIDTVMEALELTLNTFEEAKE